MSNNTNKSNDKTSDNMKMKTPSKLSQAMISFATDKQLNLVSHKNNE